MTEFISCFVVGCSPMFIGMNFLKEDSKCKSNFYRLSFIPYPFHMLSEHTSMLLLLALPQEDDHTFPKC